MPLSSPTSEPAVRARRDVRIIFTLSHCQPASGTRHTAPTDLERIARPRPAPWDHARSAGPYRIAIDYGTTNSAAAVAELSGPGGEAGTPEKVIFDGHPTIPSLVVLSLVCWPGTRRGERRRQPPFDRAHAQEQP